MRNNPSLPVDTANFPPEFKDRLLEQFEDIDDATDGILIHGDNWQALNLLEEMYRERIKCVYIDPPFNTGGDDFLYKDTFQNSSWLSMMDARLQLSESLMRDSGFLYLHLDHYADYFGRMLLQNIFPNTPTDHQTVITWNTGDNISGFKVQRNNWIRQADKILCFPKNPGKAEFIKMWIPIDEHVKQAKEQFGWLDFLGPSKDALYVERWRDNCLRQVKVDIKSKRIGTVWNPLSFQYSEPRETESFGFATQKPENLLRRIIQSCTRPGEIVLDFFAGSGTTAAVAHKLGRKWLTVEMNENCGNFYMGPNEKGALVKKAGILGRLKLALFGDINFPLPDTSQIRRPHLTKDVGWQGGGMFKYHRIESYEDALDNVDFDKNGKNKGKDEAMRMLDDFIPRYMLRWESRKDAAFLSDKGLENPFNYKLQLSGESVQTVQADLPETFAYLIGLRIQTRRVLTDEAGRNKPRYVVCRGECGGEDSAVIWRDVSGWTKEDYKRDREFVESADLTSGARRIYVNRDSPIDGAEILDPLFRERMFPVEAEDSE